MKVLNDILGYKNLSIYQDPEFFCFSLDSVILANYSNIRLRDENIIDLGCGNGVIPLILSKRTNKKIIGVEIQKKCFDLAIESVKYNKLDNQIELINSNIKDLDERYNNYFDLILCNPPYFKYIDTSIINNNMIKSIARHEIEVNLEEIIEIASKTLKDKGRFYLVHHSERLIEIINLLQKYNFGIKKLEFAYHDYDSNCNIVLIESMKNGKNNCIIEKPLITKNYRGEE